MLDGLGPEALQIATQSAALPDLIGGYEQIKLANVARYRAELRRLNT